VVCLWGAMLMPVSARAAEKDYIPLQEITRGMTGYGLTVFEGSRVDTFAVTVIGVQKAVRAAGSLILVEVAGHGLEKSSIAQGMSGSPVFLEGRFAGALAFGWGGALRPLAGVTPAGEILNLPTDTAHTLPGEMAASGQRWKTDDPVWQQLLQPGQGTALTEAVLGSAAAGPVAPSALAGEAGWPTAEELVLPLMSEALGLGAGSDPLNPDTWFVSPLGMAGAAGGSTAQAGSLQPGSACAVPLVTGDAQLGAIGTVTWVDGDDVFMMGHPFMQRGPVNLPLATAEILTIFPSREISFKLGSVGNIVGTVHHDQRAGLAGRLGPAPRMVPIELDLTLPGAKSPRHFSFQVVDDPQLTPTLVFWALYNSLLVEGDDASRQNLTYSIELAWEGPGSVAGQPLVLTGVAAGPGGVGRLSTEFMAPVSLLLNNPFADVRLVGVKAAFQIQRPLATATVSGVTVPRLVASAGQELRCQVEVTPWLAEPRLLDVTLALPADLPAGDYRLAVANAAEMFALDAQRAPGSFQVSSLDGMMRLLSTGRSAGTLVVSLLAPGQGMVLEGRQLNNLPGRVARVLRSGNMEISPTMADYVVRQESSTGWVLQGHAVRNIRVAEAAEPAQQERRP
jgi:hypothetical protein